MDFYNNPKLVTPEELEADMRVIPEWRRLRAMAIKSHLGRVLSVKAMLLLMKGLHEVYGWDSCPEFAYGKCGKPYFPERPDIQFNLSHCPCGAMCVIDDRDVGCDIECISRKANFGIMDRYYNDDEQRRVRNAESPNLEFLKLWTLKESVCKCTGRGISDELPRLLMPDNLKKYEISCNVDYARGYVYSTCRRKA